MSDALLRQISGDVREVRGDVKVLLATSSKHEVRIDALERAAETPGRFLRWLEVFRELPFLAHVIWITVTLLVTAWGLTHAWLAKTLDEGPREAVHSRMEIRRSR